ncbi:MAG TPA: hypothetical protein VFI65_10430 [Streptosporangiaceae bacterium]|nr:hypothetical protein [Streptosporangiaceae bacterium]
MTATATEPATSQRQAIRDLLRRQPSLVDGGPLRLLYSRHWARQASWICAFARAAGLEAELVPVAGPASAFERRLRQAADGVTSFALANMALDLPAGTVQLAGVPGAPPLDLWQPDAAIEAAAVEAAAGLPASQVIRTAGSEVLELGVTSTGWRTDVGLRANGQARVSPAGAVLADVAWASGTFVANGAIGVNRPVRWDARLATAPVTITVREGVVTKVECDAPDLLHFLRRAVEVHGAALVGKARIGFNRHTPGFSPDQGPVNDCHPGVTLTLSVEKSARYSPASADLLIELTASTEGPGDGADAEPIPADR